MRRAWAIVPVLVVLASFFALGLGPVPPLLLFFAGAMLCVALVCFEFDPWAGAFLGYVMVRSLLPLKPLSMETAFLIGFGIVVLVAAQRTPDFAVPGIRTAVVTLGLIQIGYAVLQADHYDPFWMGWEQATQPLHIHGFTGNPNYLGALLAITAALVPWWMLPLWILGLALAHSLLAAVAFGAMLLTRYREQWRIMVPVAVLTAGLSLVLRHRTWVLGQARVAVWWGALHELARSPLFGFGPGGWLRSAPLARYGGGSEIFAQAHNEFLQVFYEGGVVALALVGGWCWAHRRAFLARPFGPALVAIAVDAFGMFPFQIPQVGLVCLLLMGLATRSE